MEPWIPITEDELATIQKEGDSYRAPLLHFKTSVSSGTYIRSLISDIGKSMRSSSYMVKLIRCQQQDWALDKNNVFKLEDFELNDEQIWNIVLEKVLLEGSSVDIKSELLKAKTEFESPKALDVTEDITPDKIEVGLENEGSIERSNKRQLDES